VQTLVLPADVHDRLRAYLDAPHERMAFLLAEASTNGEPWTVVDDLYLTDGEDYAYQGPFGMELADHVRARVLQWATPTCAALVEVHAHGGYDEPTSFSPTDIEGLDNVVPQMLWRLRGRPYTAVVVGGDDLDVLTWDRRGVQPRTLAAVVLGDRNLTPTGITLAALTSKDEER
jgi:hypothetical protein